MTPAAVDRRDVPVARPPAVRLSGTPRRIASRVYRNVVAPAYYWRALTILRRYARHHEQARRAFVADGHVASLVVDTLEDVGVRVIGPDGRRDGALELPGTHRDAVAAIAREVDRRFALSKNCSFFPALTVAPVAERTADVHEVRKGDVITLQLDDVLGLDGLEALCRPLLEQLEQHIFGSYVVVDKVYVYRSLVGHQTRQAAWLWHYDNHPREILKVMVYLTDVTDARAPFEYLRDQMRRPVAGAPLTPLYGYDRVPDEIVRARESGGCDSCRVTGPSGTTLVFDNNVVHRAVLAREGHRDALVFQVRPVTFKARPYVDPRWTGSFQHAAFNPDPGELAPLTRKPRHFQR